MHGKGIPEGTLVVVKYPSAWENCLGIVTEKVEGHSSPVSLVSLQGGSRAFTITINDIGLRPVADTDDINFVSPDEALLEWRLKGVIAGGAATYDDGDSHYETKFRSIEEQMARCRLER